MGVAKTAKKGLRASRSLAHFHGKSCFPQLKSAGIWFEV
jgi:hypothetical protein